MAHSVFSVLNLRQRASMCGRKRAVARCVRHPSLTPWGFICRTPDLLHRDRPTAKESFRALRTDADAARRRAATLELISDEATALLIQRRPGGTCDYSEVLWGQID